MKQIIVSLLCMLVLGLFLHLTNEYDAAYRPHPTTWDGVPGYFGQLHRDGWYTFYNRDFVPIATFPAGEAVHLH